jgi:hypothetical protein
MTIIGDVHYYVIKPIRIPQPVKTSFTQPPKSPLNAIVNFVFPQAPDSPGTRRAKDVKDRFNQKLNHESETHGIFSQLLNLHPKPTPLQFRIRQEAYESDIELEDRAFIGGKRRNSFDDAYSELAPNLRPTSKGKIVLLDKTQASRHRNVRSVAFANERTNSMTIDDWIRLKNDPSPEAIVMSPSTRVVVDPESPTKRRAGKSPVQHATDVKLGGEELTNKFYRATYHSSDDDYLMHPSVRLYFKQNALEDQDQLLFTISTSVDPTSNEEIHPTLANLSLFLSSDETRMSSEVKKALKWIILLYGIVSFLIVNFGVPKNFQYVAAFFLFFLFCIGLITCL